MKAKHAITLLVSGYCFDFIGGLFKILHRSGADTLLIVAAILKIFGLLLFLYKLSTYPRIKSFSTDNETTFSNEANFNSCELV